MPNIYEFEGVLKGFPDGQEVAGLDYIAATDLTASNTFRADHITRGELQQKLEKFAHAAADLDRYKKAMFRQRSRTESNLPYTDEEVRGNPDILDNLIAGMGHEDLFHGIIGIATESGEMAEILIKLLQRERVDETNVKEEIGDVLWYLSRLVKWAGTTFLTEMKRNIAKLRARHGTAGFNKNRDITRDLDGERQVLDGKS